MTKATHRITKLRIGEISLVGEGDNPDADVLILKHRDIVTMPLDAAIKSLGDVRTEAVAIAKALSEGGSPMDIEELQGKLDKIEKSLETAQAENVTLKGQVEEITKARDEALADLEKAKKKIPAAGGKGDNVDDQDEDDVMKNLPENVRSLIEKEREGRKALEASIEKERDERAELEQIEKVRATGLGDAEKFGKLLHRVAKGKSTPEDAGELTELLQKARAMQNGGEQLFQRIGKAKGDDTVAGNAEAKLNEAIANIQKAKPNLTQAQAYNEALEANPGLYDEIQKAKHSA